jgi:predicted lipid-binding transport protein (Tim44 family)
MRKLIAVLTALIGFSIVGIDAEAKRVGGGRSTGMQREATPHQTPAKPAQQATQPQQTQPTAPPAQPASGMSRWLGPLAGLAIGAGLAALFMNNGMGGALMGILLLAALVFGAVMLFRLFRGGRASQNQPLRYAGADAYGRSEPVAAPTPQPAPAPAYGGGAAPHSIAAATSGAAPAPAASRWPADFDAEEFARHAKANFLKLQEANDRRDLAALRDFLTPEMVREIEADIRASGDAPQKTEVVTLESQVLDVVTENGSYIVSVRFSGLIRETPGEAPQPFSEIWHLQKPLDGRSGWLVAGIQQA